MIELSDEEFEAAFQAIESMPDCPYSIDEMRAAALQEQVKRHGRPVTPDEALKNMRLQEDPEWQKANPPCALKEIKEQRRQVREERRQRKEQGRDILPANP